MSENKPKKQGKKVLPEEKLQEDLQEHEDVIEVLGFIDGKVFAKVRVGGLKVHDTIRKVRAKSPKIDQLTATIKNLKASGPLYNIMAWAAREKPDGTPDEELHLYLGDGAQRHRAVLENGIKDVVVGFPIRWETVEDVLREGLAANTARYAMTDADIMSLLRTKITPDDVALFSGQPRSKVDKLKKIAPHNYFLDAVAEDFIRYTVAHALLSACGEKPSKFEALERSFVEHLEKCKSDAVAQKLKMKNSKGTRYTSKQRALGTLKYYGSQTPWDDWVSALQDNSISNGKLNTSNAVTRKVGITIDSNPATMRKKFAVLGLRENIAWEDINRDDLKALLKIWPKIGKCIDDALKQEETTEEDDRKEAPKTAPKQKTGIKVG